MRHPTVVALGERERSLAELETPFHPDALFAADPPDPQTCERVAEELGLDMEAFRACVTADSTIDLLKRMPWSSRSAGS